MVLDTPLSLYVKLANERQTFLLESVEGGEKVGRYSFLGKDPFLILRSRGGKTIVDRAGQTSESDSGFVPALRRHLDRHGFPMVQVAPGSDELMHATRLDPDHPWVRWALASIERSTGRAPVLLPNLGGSLPNDCFADVLGMPTIWVPHSYASCSQHAPNEHVLAPLLREGLQIMTGMFWDMGETPPRM